MEKLERGKSMEERYRYRYETHCHNSWCSACGVSTPQEIAAAYHACGFAGIIITDHFLRGNTAVDRSLPWGEIAHEYYNAYLAAKDWAQGKDFDVLFGIEHAYGDGKEVLTYGIGLDFLLDNPDIHLLPLSEYAALVHGAGGFLSMAHPFRDRGYINMAVGPQPAYLDALEVYNYHNRPEENEKALALARETGLLQTAGGDVHEQYSSGIGQAGVAFAQRVRTGEELVEALRSGDYRLVVAGETVPNR